MTRVEDSSSQNTSRAFLWNSLLRTPFWALFAMLPFILYKDLGATSLEITALFTIKPVVSLFALHWSHHIHQRKDRLRANILWATVLGYFPFLFIPWFSSPWYFIGASGVFMLFNRGVIPAWMELLKLNVPDPKRSRIFSIGSTFSYLGGGAFPFLIGWLLDDFTEGLFWIFPATALMGIASVFWYRHIKPVVEDNAPIQEPISWTVEHLISPWKQAWSIIIQRPDFARFQLGFLLGGAGLMIMQPALPAFFVDSLELSHTDLAVALTLCKGIGFALASPFWASWMNRINIYRFSAWVTILAALFPVGLALANFNMVWVFIAYLGYGIMQAGSEMSWNLSGTIFARNQDSSAFTGINVLMIGLRGCVAPPLGSLLCVFSGPSSVLFLSGILCLGGTAALRYGERRELRENI